MLTRRFRHGLDEREEIKREKGDESFGSFTKFPDLLLMDGGRGQVNIALQVLEELRAADTQQLCEVPGITKNVAREIYEFFRRIDT